MIHINRGKNIIEIEGKPDEILVELTALVLGTLSRIKEDKREVWKGIWMSWYIDETYSIK